jgi:uncharacterized membrane protein
MRLHTRTHTHTQDIIHTNLSVREGLELVVSVGMGLPETILATKVTKHLVEALQRERQIGAGSGSG